MSNMPEIKTKNRPADLQNILFEELERLNDESLSDDELKRETARADAIANIADKMIANSKLVLNALIFMEKDNISGQARLPRMLES